MLNEMFNCALIGSTATLSGTQMTLTCSIAHGFGIYFYLSDEGLPVGASWTIEIAS